jgi:2-alkenal reductase
MLGVSLALVALTGGCKPRSATSVQAAGATAPQPAPEAAGDATTKRLVAHTGASGPLAALEGTLEDVYSSLNKSVVNLQVLQKAAANDVEIPDLGPMPFGPRPKEHPKGYQREGSGSGFVWDKQGHIVTNNHVVADADKIRVTFPDGTIVGAKVVGTDPDSDLAVVKVELPAERLTPVEVADSSQVKVGQLAIAIGNPFGLEGTMTVGFISALGRLLPTQPNRNEPTYTIPDVLQTDAPINPGNSGGVLADSHGAVIGVTSAIISPAGANAGIGFAIPSTVVAKVVPVLITKGHYEHAYLGVEGINLNPDMAKAMGLRDDQRGGLVVKVMPGSPSDKAGLRGSDKKVEIDGESITVGGDVITALGERPIKSFDDVVTELARAGDVGKTITLTVLRGGKTEKVPVVLTARPGKGGNGETKTASAGDDSGVKLGIAGIDLTPPVARAMNLPSSQQGVLVQSVERGSAADKGGVRGSFKPLPGDNETNIGGDVIVAFDGKPVTGLEELQGLLRSVNAGDTATLTVLRGSKREELKVTFAK